MDFMDKFNSLSRDMAKKMYIVHSSGKPDDEAQLFELLQHCFMTQNMVKIRLSEIPSLFERMYSRPLSAKLNLVDLLRSPNLSIICVVKQMNQLIWIEPTPEFAEMNKKVQEMRRLYVEPVLRKEAEEQRRQFEAQTAQFNDSESDEETDGYLQDAPLEHTPHYKMFVVEFSETLQRIFQDIDFGIEDHTDLLWLYLIHLFTISKKKYRVSVSELPELFREYYGHTLELSKKLIATLQEDCYLVCQTEKFKNDWHVKPSEELVHFLNSYTGEELQEIISYNLEALQERYQDCRPDDDFPAYEVEPPVQKPVTQQTKQNTNDKTKAQSNNANSSRSGQKSNEPILRSGFLLAQPSNNNTSKSSSTQKHQNNNAKSTSQSNQRQTPPTQPNVNTVPASPLVLNGTDIGTYGAKGRELAMKEHLEKEQKKAEQAAANNKQASQAQSKPAQQTPPRSQQNNRSPSSERSNKASSKARNNKSPGQYVKKTEVANNTNTNSTPSPEPSAQPTTITSTSTSSLIPKNDVQKPAPVKPLSEAEQLADTVKNEFSCNMCNQILRRPVESTCCHKLVCYVCSLFNGLCPLCKKPGQRVTWVENHVVNHLMNRLTMPCPYKQCDEWVPLNDIFLHKDHCEHKPQPCPNKACGASKHYSELDAHIDTCPFTVITCACKQQIKRRDLEKHLATCKKKQGTGQQNSAPAQQKQQEKRSNQVKCPYGCDAQIEQSALEAHGNQLVNCTNYGCPAVLKHSDLNVHRNACAYRRVPCTNGCGWQDAVKDLNKHQANCKNRK